MISVPDLETMSRMYLDPEITGNDHWMVTRMMYGGQVDAYDYHLVC